MGDKWSICLIAEGKWACAVINMVANNASRLEDLEDKVCLFDYDFYKTLEERLKDADGDSDASSCNDVDDLPSNVVAYADIQQSARNADIIILCVSLKTLYDCCARLRDRIKPNAFAIFFVKEAVFTDQGDIDMGSDIIYRNLGIRCSKIVGSDLTTHLIKKEFCEAIIGCHDTRYAKVLLGTFRTDNFRVTVADDIELIEIWFILKHVIGFAFGFVSGLNYGEGAKSAVIRMGIQESFCFLDTFYPGGKLATFFESCGISDLIRECYIRKETKIAEEFVKTRKPFARLELEILGTSKNQNVQCCKGVYKTLHSKSMDDVFPLFVACHKICTGEFQPEYLKDVLKNSTLEIFHPLNTLPL